MKKMTKTLLVSLLLTGCGGNDSDINSSVIESAGSLALKGEVWADNWFALYLGEELLLEDSVPITTERSFNAETFTFNATPPIHLNFMFKDFKENDTGLEYIGARNQQMGDGGFIAQFHNVDTGEMVAVSNSAWRCLVIHQAPLDKSCESSENPIAGEGACSFVAMDEPANWKSAEFDDSGWNNATVHSEFSVSPKGGYDEIDWHSSAQLLWAEDLETDNTLLCKATIQ